MRKKACGCRKDGAGPVLERHNGGWRCKVCETVYVKLKTLDYKCTRKPGDDCYYDSRKSTLTCHRCGNVYDAESKEILVSDCETLQVDCMPVWDNYHKIMRCQVCGDVFVPEDYKPPIFGNA